jgi:hypothetical protein
VLTAAVSTTNVQKYGNGFLMLTKTFTIVAPDVEAWWSPNPEGPWQDLGLVYSVPAPPPSFVAGFVYHQSYTYNVIALLGTHLATGS